MSKTLQKLKGGDLRSIGKANEVVGDILKNPQLFEEVFDGMLNDDPLIRMRSADALEKVSATHPEYLQPFKDRLINKVSKIEQQEVRWHVAQMFSYLKVSRKERDTIINILLSYIEGEKSNIVKVNSMQALGDLADRDERIREKVICIIENEMKDGSPAIMVRGRKLLEKLTK